MSDGLCRGESGRMTISTAIAVQDGSASDGAAAKGAQRAARAAYAALGWVVLFFTLHVYWYLGGSWASPGELPDPPHRLLAGIVSVTVAAAFPLGALVCLAIARGWARGRLAQGAQILVLVGTVLLLVRGGAGIVDDVTRATGLLPKGITGLSLEEATGHAHLRWSDWAIDVYFLVGGIAFGLVALRQRLQGRPSQPSGARCPGPGGQRPVPEWAERLAHLIPLLVLPSGLWRLAVAFGFSMGMLDAAGERDVLRGWAAVYVAVISLLSEAVALTAFGLVRPWGEVLPRWVPFFGGRALRPRTVVVAATCGSVALMLIWTVGFWDVWTGDQASSMASPFWAAVFALCYAPLNLWGPALLALTWAYRRRTAGSSRSLTG